MVYLDNAATTRVCPEAAEAAVHMMTECFGNPSTTYKLGREAKAAVDKARGQIAKALGCQPDEVYFTSCGSEGDNWALISGARSMRRRGKHIISSAVEHDAVRKSLDFLEKEGYEITRLQPDGAGAIPLERVCAALRPDTILVSLMMVNNETGAINDIAAVARMLKAENSIALLHTDAVQGFLKVPFSAKTLGADLITISGHKIHAPKGIGALYIRSGLKLPPYIHGGGQDLIFPHHENEIAQSCALHDAPMARYWMHNGFITINSEKMSKSKGNFFLLRDILERFDPEVVRFYLLSVQYRSPLDFDDEKIEVAGRGLERIKHAAESADKAMKLAGTLADDDAQNLRAQAEKAKADFCAAMNDDFNTALAIAALFELAKDINIYLKKDQFDRESLAQAREVLGELADVLGITLTAEAANDDLADKLMDLIIAIRKDAREGKDFATADRIRDGLAEIGVILEDGKAGTTWKRA